MHSSWKQTLSKLSLYLGQGQDFSRIIQTLISWAILGHIKKLRMCHINKIFLSLDMLDVSFPLLSAKSIASPS